MAILDRVDWDSLDILVGIQQRNRERHAPAVSLFRWWARHPDAVAGAILDAARAEFGTDRYVVADPFSGGGTVAFEAVRRGLTVYAQDLWELSGKLGHSSLRRGDYRYFPRFPEADAEDV